MHARADVCCLMLNVIADIVHSLHNQNDMEVYRAMLASVRKESIIDMTTIKDVSKLSGLSVGTISRYLNGNKIKDENKQKIDSAIETLGFRVNLMARGLKTNQTFTIGVVVPSMTDIFSNQVIEGIDERLEGMGYSLITCSSRNNLAVEREKLQFLKEKRVDGIILMTVSDEGSHVQEIIGDSIPLVLVDRLLSGVTYDAIVSDNAGGAYKAVEALIRKGHQRIGIIAGPQSIYTAKERLDGYRKAHEDYKIPVDESLILYGKYEYGGGQEAIEAFWTMADKPTAIFTSNYETTLSAIKYLLENNIKIGETVSLHGFDNADFFRLMNPAITTIQQPTYSIGAAATELLHRRIGGDDSMFPLIQSLPTESVAGNSIKVLI